jgi:hypothetical protein
MNNIPAMIAKERRESIRWHILSLSNFSRPMGINTSTLHNVIKGTYQDLTHLEVRQEVDYLEKRDLVTIEKDPLDHWFVKLTRHGIDVVENTVHIEPGINRPILSQV